MSARRATYPARRRPGTARRGPAAASGATPHRARQPAGSGALRPARPGGCADRPCAGRRAAAAGLHAHHRRGRRAHRRARPGWRVLRRLHAHPDHRTARPGAAGAGDPRLAGLPCARRDARHQPRQGTDARDAVRACGPARWLEDQPASAVHRAHLRLRPPPRRVGRRVADDRRGHPAAGCLLPGALHRAGAEPEHLRPHGALAAAAALRAARRDARVVRHTLGHPDAWAVQPGAE